MVYSLAKRLLDISVAVTGLLLFSVVILPVMLLVWLQDFHGPFYIAKRIGKNGKLFNMVKLRSMVKGADQTGVDSAAATDKRITPLGHFIRKTKLDEVVQLWNVLIGNMSLVGPRPNVASEVALYTELEQGLLTVKPGITDFASIVFADLAEILRDKTNPNLAYNQLVRPWKSRLGLLYVAKRNFYLDLQLIFLTGLSLFSRQLALKKLTRLLIKIGAELDLLRAAKRKLALKPYPPPGSKQIVLSR